MAAVPFMATPLAGALAGGAIGLAGQALFGQRDDPTGKPLAPYDQIMLQKSIQEEFAKNGIQWRVQDAINAGVHPVYALGGSGASFSAGPVTVSESGGPTGMGEAFQSMGQDVSRAVAATETPDQRALRMMQLDAASSSINKDDQQASYYAALAAKTRQEMLQSAGMPSLLPSGGGSGAGGNSITIPSSVMFAPGNTDAVQLSGNQIPSSRSGDPSTGAGVSPAWMEVQLTPGAKGFKMLVPMSQGESWAESLGEMPIELRVATYLTNMSRNPNFWTDFYRQVIKGEPEPSPRVRRSREPFSGGGEYLNPGARGRPYYGF